MLNYLDSVTKLKTLYNSITCLTELWSRNQDEPLGPSSKSMTKDEGAGKKISDNLLEFVFTMLTTCFSHN